MIDVFYCFFQSEIKNIFQNNIFTSALTVCNFVHCTESGFDTRKEETRPDWYITKNIGKHGKHTVKAVYMAQVVDFAGNVFILFEVMRFRDHLNIFRCMCVDNAVFNDFLWLVHNQIYSNQYHIWFLTCYWVVYEVEENKIVRLTSNLETFVHLYTFLDQICAQWLEEDIFYTVHFLYIYKHSIQMLSSHLTSSVPWVKLLT